VSSPPSASLASSPAPTSATAAAAPPVAAKPGAKAGAPTIVEGSDIPRAALLAVLSGGVGRFLQRVQLEPALDKGRFVGWRLVRLFDDAQAGQGALKPGDTLLRVNGQSIERPEQFKNVWDSLATESQLILQVDRAGQKSEIRHRIVQ
jgi:type II secretory pathway component PulC